MVILSVLYAAADGAHFDHDYYNATHIPLVHEAFAATGLTGVQVFRGLSAGDGSPAPFILMAHLAFRDASALQASMGGSRAAEVLADVARFTNVQPTTQVSALI
ncbi:EthD family reductase [Caulobacter henricii]|uniref:Ethyl tert-butyl ether degradation protein EthD n=1 Tax=Caulobacter henricii TaxID=69395 RepID=A0A0P0NW97_9CAUL|nr:EthD family reductase [Caulobacter henricii]ALL12062.1 ethyl tert-butyl ether degradation protein EthD [Caulobacter henricii]